MFGITQRLRWLLPLSSFSAHAEPFVLERNKRQVSLTIIGSVYVGEPSMFPLPDDIYQALNNSDGLIVESTQPSNSKSSIPNFQASSKFFSQEQLFNLDHIASEFGLNVEQFHIHFLHGVPLYHFSSCNAKLGYETKMESIFIWCKKAIETKVPLVPLERCNFRLIC